MTEYHSPDDDGPRALEPPPLAAELEHYFTWPKSDKSDFGWRDREGTPNG